MRGIVVLEGSDATGKSSLARALLDDYGGRYVHNRVYKNPWLRHLASVRYALRHGRSQLVVLDRLWLSEQIYGSVFRGGPAYDLGARFLDHVLREAGAVNVLCVRADVGRHMAEFDRLREARAEAFDSMDLVAKLYRDLVFGDERRAGGTYFDQLVREAGYITNRGPGFGRRPDVLLYDMDLWHGDRARRTFASLVCATLDRRYGRSEEP